MPIVFLPAAPHPSPVFLVGARGPDRTFTSIATANRIDNYVPAFVRRYPVPCSARRKLPPTPSSASTRNTKACGKGRRRAAAFSEDGLDTPLLQEYARLTETYFAAAKRTETFLETLAALQLLRSVTIDIRSETGASAALHGFLTIDETRLNALPDADFLRLRAEGFLPAIYAHFFSLTAIDRLRQLSAPAKA